MTTEARILVSRLLTRSGDQAWDFAIPIVLMSLYPESMRLAFFYFFISKLATVFLMPIIGKGIDRRTRRDCLKLGIASQAAGVALSLVLIFALQQQAPYFGSREIVLYPGLLIAGILATLGMHIMDISVSNDLVPQVISSEELPQFNSRLRQLDLLTEVLSPIAAGALLLLTPESYRLLGFSLIAFWNLASFYPEFFLLNQIIGQSEELNNKRFIPENLKKGVVQKIKDGRDVFLKLPVSGVIIAYSLLWLSALSPHGVLLTAFLKGGWNLPETDIGIFRGLGALFGLLATFAYPLLRKRNSLNLTAKYFIAFQALALVTSCLFFFEESSFSQYAFLLLILLSRIGLYGFSLAEVELRQLMIPSELRGQINGVASSLNSLATLLIFGVGLIFSTPDLFKYTVLISVFAVGIAALFFQVQSRKYRGQSSLIPR